ncbi:hypothetical protein J4466_05105 [Candidatus Pacearchaeota archaeon]|nr:hypothetical protein [Candidatus Pacearchaeota archaeon]
MGRKLIGVNLIAIIIVVLLISILYGLSDAGFSRNLAAFLGKNFNVGFLAFFSLPYLIISIISFYLLLIILIKKAKGNPLIDLGIYTNFIALLMEFILIILVIKIPIGTGFEGIGTFVLLAGYTFIHFIVSLIAVILLVRGIIKEKRDEGHIGSLLKPKKRIILIIVLITLPLIILISLIGFGNLFSLFKELIYPPYAYGEEPSSYTSGDPYVVCEICKLGSANFCCSTTKDLPFSILIVLTFIVYLAVAIWLLFRKEKS